jgi:hypothetical protein
MEPLQQEEATGEQRILWGHHPAQSTCVDQVVLFFVGRYLLSQRPQHGRKRMSFGVSTRPLKLLRTADTRR